MYTQRLENPHNAPWESRAVLPEDVARSWIIHSFILEALVHGVITTQVQINCKLIVRGLYIISVTEFKINPSILLLELIVSNDY